MPETRFVIFETFWTTFFWLMCRPMAGQQAQKATQFYEPNRENLRPNIGL